MALLLGKKLGMTQVYNDQGVMVPVTVIQAGPCTVMQVKTTETDGYNALQLGFDDVKDSRRKKPQVGHAKKADALPKRFVREWRMTGEPEQALGDELTVDLFDETKYVDVVGTSKGRGYCGVVRRHNFKGQLASHGVERKHRSPGSIQVCSGAKGRGIKKGKRMAGHYGVDRITSKNHVLVGVDKENNLLLVKGSVPGPRNGYLIVTRSPGKKHA